MRMNHNVDLPDVARIYELWEKYKTPETVIAHSKAVWECCKDIIKESISQEAGTTINCDYLKAASLLHDIVRQLPKHEDAGADILLQEGYQELAETVRRHSDFPKTDWQMPFATETAILYLADKRIGGTERISIEERFARSRERIRENGDVPEAIAAHKRRYEQAVSIRNWIENL